MLLAQTSSCHNVRQGELIAIIALLGGLLTFAATAGASAVTISILPVVAKLVAFLTVGASLASITLPFDALLDIAAVAAVVEGIKHILECG